MKNKLFVLLMSLFAIVSTANANVVSMNVELNASDLALNNASLQMYIQAANQLSVIEADDSVSDVDEEAVNIKTSLYQMALKSVRDVEPYINNGFNKNKTFTVVRGEPLRRIAVFINPTCGHCKLFESNLKELNNIAITYIYVPNMIANPKSKEIINRLWNMPAKNRYQAWQNYAENDVLPATNMFDNSKAKKYDYDYAFKVSNDLAIHVTPTVFNIKTGKLFEGALYTSAFKEDFLNEGLTPVERTKAIETGSVDKETP